MKTKLLLAASAACLTLTSCGLGSVGTTNNTATTDVASTLLQTTGEGLLNSVLSSLLGTQTNQNSLVGTWTYKSPKVVFESNSVLANLGGKVVSSNLETKLGTQLGKMGFTAGTSTLTLNEDKTCSLVTGGKTASGTYTYDSSSNIITFTSVFGVGSVACTATVSGSELYLLFDADKLLTVAKALKSSSSSSLSSLISNYSGLKLGWTMSK